ncbi:helix-turn-helix domain-containing protein [Streptomyces lasalocidi]
MDAQSEEITVEQAAEDFAAELARWREVRGMSKRALAQAMGFDPSYVSHMESGRHKPSEDFARLADEALNSRQGDLAALGRVRAGESPARHGANARRPHRPRAGPSSRTPPAPPSSSNTTPPA